MREINFLDLFKTLSEINFRRPSAPTNRASNSIILVLSSRERERERDTNLEYLFRSNTHLGSKRAEVKLVFTSMSSSILENDIRILNLDIYFYDKIELNKMKQILGMVPIEKLFEKFFCKIDSF